MFRFSNAKNIVSTTLEKTHILSVLILLRYLKNGAKMMLAIRTGKTPQSLKRGWLRFWRNRKEPGNHASILIVHMDPLFLRKSAYNAA